MLKGFKEFLMRGNVVELAVAVIIGTAFTAIVTAIADSLIRPLIAAFGGGKVTGLTWQINNKESTIDFAAIITAILNFLIVAAVVYFMIVLPMKKLQDRRKRGEEPPPDEPSDVDLLTEIRDLLRQQQGQQPTQHQGYPPQGGQQHQPPRGQQPPPPQQPPRRQY